MIPVSHRYVFICEIGVATVFNRFTPPTAREVFELLRDKCREGKLPVKSTGLATGKIEKITIDGDYAAVLFRYTDPEISESTAEDTDTKALRILALKPKELHAVSAHILIDISAKHDAKAAYPAVVENVDWLSRSLMIACLNAACTAFFTEKRRKPGAKEDQEYGVRLKLRGHQSSTLKNILSNGGVLHGLQLEGASVTDDGFGEGKYAVVTSQQYDIRIKGRPTGESAIDWLKRKVKSSKDEGIDTAKVVIESEGRVKTQKLDLKLTDITENFLIKQTKLDGFKAPLRNCEPDIRTDLMEKMKKVMPK